MRTLFNGRPMSADAEFAYLSLAALATSALELPVGDAHYGRWCTNANPETPTTAN